MSALVFRERPSAGEPAGLLVLHHGRGADEQDLLGLADVLDPERRLHVVTPRGPLTLPGWPGYHWYVVPRVGYPDPETFRMAFAALAEFHDELWERTDLGPERTVLGGFSMGAVMSYSLGLPAERPAPAGILAFSGFVPVVEGWAPSLGTAARRARSSRTGATTRSWRSTSGGAPASCSRAAGSRSSTTSPTPAISIDPAHVPAAVDWLAATLGLDSAAAVAPPQQLAGEQGERDPGDQLHGALAAKRRLAVLALAHVHGHLESRSFASVIRMSASTSGDSHTYGSASSSIALWLTAYMPLVPSVIGCPSRRRIRSRSSDVPTTRSGARPVALAVAPRVGQEARADRHVALVRPDQREHAGKLDGGVLAVGVETPAVRRSRHPRALA